MGPTWVLSAQDGPHVGPMNLAIRDVTMETKVTEYTLRIMHTVHALLCLSWFDSIKTLQMIQQAIRF